VKSREIYKEAGIKRRWVGRRLIVPDSSTYRPIIRRKPKDIFPPLMSPSSKASLSCPKMQTPPACRPARMPRRRRDPSGPQACGVPFPWCFLPQIWSSGKKFSNEIYIWICMLEITSRLGLAIKINEKDTRLLSPSALVIPPW
jgi:hypothetical protein